MLSEKARQFVHRATLLQFERQTGLSSDGLVLQVVDDGEFAHISGGDQEYVVGPFKVNVAAIEKRISGDPSRSMGEMPALEPGVMPKGN